LGEESPKALLEFYRRLAQDFHSSPEIQKLYGSRLFRHGKFKEAARVYGEIARLDPGDSESRIVLVQALLCQERVSEALEPLREAEALLASDAQAQARMALLYGEAGMAVEAERLYRRGAELARPARKASMLCLLASFYEHHGRYEEALETIEEALPVCQEDRRSSLEMERASLLLLLDRDDEAEKIYRGLIEASPKDQAARLGLALLCDGAGRSEEAERLYRQAIDVSETAQKASALLRLAAFYSDRERYEESLSALDEAVAVCEPSLRYDIELQRADVLDLLGRLDETERVYRLLIEREPQRTTASVGLGMLLDKADRIEEAERLYRAVIELEPDHAQAHNNLGYMLAVRGLRLDEARQAIEKAVELEPGVPAYLDSLGWVLFKQGQLDAAVKRLEEAATDLPVDPASAEIYEHLAEAYLEAGQKARAIETYRKAAAADPNRPSLLRRLEALEKSE
jgi:tetratricopeptide (TPR) repeat protein